MSDNNHQNLHKEIDLIQDCIKRMAHNSFLLKGWAITLVAVVLALVDKKVSPYFLGLVILFPLVSFWYLDAFFLYTEKLFRKMYEWVITERPKGNSDHMYDLNPHRFKKDLKIPDSDRLQTIRYVMWTKTLRWFYLIPIGLVFAVFMWISLSTNAPAKDGQPATQVTEISIQGSGNGAESSSQPTSQAKTDQAQPSSTETDATGKQEPVAEEDQPQQPASEQNNE